MNYKQIIPAIVFLVVFLGHAVYIKIFQAQNSPLWWSIYLEMELYFIGLSLGLAFSYGVFSFIKLKDYRIKSRGSTIGSAILAFFVWFTSCCGAPLLVALIGILGIGAGTIVFPPKVIAVLSITLVSLGYLWLRRQTAGAELVCNSCEMEVIKMADEGKLYVCEVCGAEVRIIKKTVPDPKCPTLTCCGKEMKEKVEE